MKRIIICCDGTANAALAKGAIPTNVQRISELALPADSSGCTQITYYHPGVGTPTTDEDSGSLMDQAYGYSVDLHVKELYKFLVDNYVEGDEIFCFGFSRGAFTVRTLLGLIKHFGILDKRGFAEIPNEKDPTSMERSYYDATMINNLYEIYRSKGHRDGRGLPRDKGQCIYPVPIKFLGVFDTVKALPESKDFHDIELHEGIAIARQALAIDEHRMDFKPCLWSPLPTVLPPMLPRSLQVWFTGAHADIGGGYGGEEAEDRGLANTALHWMLEEAGRCGLDFNRDSLALYKPEPIVGTIHDELLTEGDNAFRATAKGYVKPKTESVSRDVSYSSAKLYQARGRTYRHVCEGYHKTPHLYYPPEDQARRYGMPGATTTFGDPKPCFFSDTALSETARKRITDTVKGTGMLDGRKREVPYECTALFSRKTQEGFFFATEDGKRARLKPPVLDPTPEDGASAGAGSAARPAS